MDDQKPIRNRPRRVIRPAKPGHNALAVGLILVGGVAGGFFVLASAGMRSTAGARVSTRLQWEQRSAELDQIIAKAEAEGKLRNPGTTQDGR